MTVQGGGVRQKRLDRLIRQWLSIESKRFENNPQTVKLVEYIVKVAKGHPGTMQELLDSSYAIGNRFFTSSQSHDWRKLAFDFDPSKSNVEFDFNTKRSIHGRRQ